MKGLGKSRDGSSLYGLACRAQYSLASERSMKPDDIHLRPATEADRAFLWRLHLTTLKQYIEATWKWDEASQRDFFNQNFGVEGLQIILHENESIGMIRIDPREDCVYLGAIQITPAYQNRGLGASLIQRLIEDAGREDLPVELDVLKTNKPAQRLYDRLGFSIHDETRTRYIMRTPEP